ncbi:MAG TPA: molybdopterin cofactor-binding domain-containing protein [Burkholderiales bacterium]|nr:molybdopterin cofactor-binding domain-containing protein [Burkholderiales bacterium]
MTSRRAFLKSSGALVIAFSLDAFAQAPAAPSLPGSLAGNRMLNAWLRIDPDGTVTIFTGKIELGQGIGTALAQIAADELDVDLKRIRLVHGDTALTPNEGQTAGSLSVQTSGTAVRYACAEARAMLLAAAASKLSIPANDLKVVDGTINGSVTYWALAGELDLKKEATASVKPKPPSEHQWVGKSIPRHDIPKKFTGGAAYVQDIRLPGMLFGRVVRPPSPGAKLASLDESSVKRMQGVVAVVRDGDFVAVATEREEQAIKARAALAKSAVWKESATLPPSGAELYQHMQSLDVPAQVMVDRTSATAAPAAKTLQARYTRPFQLHGSIGPSCAVAQWTDGKLRVWTHSQGVYPLRGDLANVFGIEPSAVRCTHAEGAGCYGHNGADDVALDAALLARATNGRPVKLQWMRDDEFMWEPYGSAMVMQLGASLDAQGNVVSWSHELWSHPHSRRPGQSKGSHTLAARHLEKPVGAAPVGDVPLPSGGSDRNAIPGYDFPSVKVAKHFIVDSPLRTSALRTLGGYANVFALESFMDEAALAAGVDPVEFRLRHMKDPRARAVIEATAAKAGWRAGNKDWGFGYARYKNIGCYCAVAAQVEIDRGTGAARVLRAVSGVDAGQAVNPDGIANQIEGGFIQSASWTLKESVSFDRTRVRTRSWNDYPIMRFEEVPQVDVLILNQPDQPFLGVGEGSQGPAAAAIANAIASLTGRRLRDLPFTPGKVKAALA